uniref:Uncharacterized protein n=1 Tax=Opuntia streptacantha TaxID=393608 RepID=A0A7C9F2E0_OPUST
MEALVVEKTPSPPSKKMKNRRRNGLHPPHPLDGLHGCRPTYPQLAAMKQGIILMHGGHTHSHGGAFSPHSNYYPAKHHPPLLPLPAAVSKPTFLSLPAPHSLSKSKQQKAKRIPSLTKSDDVIRGKGQPSMKQRVGSDPGNDPKKAIRVDLDVMDKSSGSSAFSLSPPPPSSLPMPKFSLIRQPQLQPKKLSSAAEVDDGATDNLRRLLRLR